MVNKKYMIVFLLCSTIFSQDYYGAGAFSQIGQSSVSLALGKTMFSDSYNPAVAMHSNPAIIKNSYMSSFFFTNRLSNTYFGEYSAGGFYKPITNSTYGFGINFVSYRVDAIEEYSQDAEFIGTLESQESYISFSISSNLNNIGWGMKFLAFTMNMSSDSTSYSSGAVGGFEAGLVYDLDIFSMNFFRKKVKVSFFETNGIVVKRFYNSKFPNNYNYSPTNMALGLSPLNLSVYFSRDLSFNLGYFQDLSWENKSGSFHSWGFKNKLNWKDFSISFNYGCPDNIISSDSGLSVENQGSLSNNLSWGLSMDFNQSIGWFEKTSIGWSKTNHSYFRSTNYFTISFLL